MRWHASSSTGKTCHLSFVLCRSIAEGVEPSSCVAGLIQSPSREKAREFWVAVLAQHLPAESEMDLHQLFAGCTHRMPIVFAFDEARALLAKPSPNAPSAFERLRLEAARVKAAAEQAGL